MLCAFCEASTEAKICERCHRDPLLDGRYRLEAVVGRGSIGVTYRGVALDTGTAVAIKELPLRSVDDLKVLELFDREARVLRQLDHPCIPRYLDDFSWGEGKHRALYIVQELVEGVTLAEEMTTRRYDEDDVLEILDGLLPILAYLHGRAPPVIHRDLKPGNVMRTEDGRLMLIDFGSVRDVVRDPVRGGSTVTGTFGYMAPEQFRGDAVPATDYYALGALIMSLASRREPAMVEDISALSMPKRIENLVRALLDHEPSKRPSTPADVRAAMHRALVPVRPPPSKARRWAALMFFALGGIGAGLAFAPTPEAPPAPPPKVVVKDAPVTLLPSYDGELDIIGAEADPNTPRLLVRREVYEALDTRTPLINRCFVQMLQREITSPNVDGRRSLEEGMRVNVTMRVDRNGRVVDPQITGPARFQRDPQMRICMLAHLRSIEMPRPSDGREARIRVPYFFMPSSRARLP